MELKRNRIVQAVFLTICTAFFSAACASFPGKEVPVYTADQVRAPEKKLTVSYNVKGFMLKKENNTFTSNIDKEIQKVLLESAMFAELKPEPGHGDFDFSFIIHNEGWPPMPVAFMNGFVSGFTFTVIPAFARDIYLLTVDVKQGDRVVKTYSYRDHVDSWIQLFLVVLSPVKWPPDVMKSTIDNMLMNFAHDFADDIHSGIYAAGKTL